MISNKNNENVISRLMNNQPIRFILVGGLNTAFGYLLFALLLTIGLKDAYALLLTTCIGVFFNFKSTGTLVFNNNNNKLLFKFIALYGFLYLFNIMLLRCIDAFIHNSYISGMLSIIGTAILSYFCNKRYIFIKE